MGRKDEGQIALPLSESDISATQGRQSSVSVRRIVDVLFKIFAVVCFCVALSASFSDLTGALKKKGHHHKHGHKHKPGHPAQPQCPAQVDPIVPKILFKPDAIYRNESAERLAGAVRIASVSYDDNGSVEEDPRWAPFYEVHSYLRNTFPQVFTSSLVNTTYINTLGLVTTLRGSNSSLKPLMLMSHIDVVPVEQATLSRWTHPPFSGHFDGEFVWGRGASDDKTLVIAQYEALSDLLEKGWKPERTVILAHGFDEEEVSAREGAGRISPYLQELYGPDSILMIIDEGTSAQEMYGTSFAMPATAEKGYVDVSITVGTPGGHSSIPPEHTGIGVISQILSAIEANPYEPTYADVEDPILQALVCGQQYAKKGTFPKNMSKLLKKGDLKGLAKEFAGTGRAQKALVSTTQAVDVIRGGVKVNALPEEVSAIVNHRIAFAHSVSHVQEHITRVVSPFAKKFDLPLHAFSSKNESDRGERYLSLDVFGEALEPAPRTPTSGDVWELFSGSVRHVHKDSSSLTDGGEATPYIVSPFASTGNTDTKVYWNLTRNIFRYMGGPVAKGYSSNAHTVNEKTRIDDHLKISEWIHTIVQNADAYRGE